MAGRTRLYVAGAITIGAAIAAAVPLSSAVSQQSPPGVIIDVEIVDTAIIGARGAVALVTVQYTCSPGSEFAFVGAQLVQRSGSGIAEGSASQEVTCDGTIQQATLPVTASGRAFKRGVAFATAFGQACAFGCAFDQDAEEIQLVRG